MKKFLSELESFEKRAKGLTQTIAPFVVAAVQQNITDMDSPANSPLTKALKGGKGPLKESGVLRGSIASTVRNDSLIVGTNQPQARALNDGATIKPKSSRSLVIPTTKQIKLYSSTKGTKGFLQMLETRGWSIHWSHKSVIGTPPPAQKGMGIKLPKSDGKKQHSYLLFYRTYKVTIPAREFMVLKKDQVAELRTIVDNYVKGR